MCVTSGTSGTPQHLRKANSPRGITRVDATHAYADFRSWPYEAVFTVTANSAVGEIVASGSVSVYVEEDPGLIVGGFDVGETSKNRDQDTQPGLLRADDGGNMGRHIRHHLGAAGRGRSPHHPQKSQDQVRLSDGQPQPIGSTRRTGRLTLEFFPAARTREPAAGNLNPVKVVSTLW